MERKNSHRETSSGSSQRFSINRKMTDDPVDISGPDSIISISHLTAVSPDLPLFAQLFALYP